MKAVDPFTDRADTWALVADSKGSGAAVADVRSTAPGTGRDGKRYADW
jgi:hypothetical protein